MKTGPFTPKPGDLFKWHYDSDDNICHDYETIWSTTMKRYVPVNGINLLISLTDTNIWWLNSLSILHLSTTDTSCDLYDNGGYIRIVGFIHARVSDTCYGPFNDPFRTAFHPRSRGK